MCQCKEERQDKQCRKVSSTVSPHGPLLSPGVPVPLFQTTLDRLALLNEAYTREVRAPSGITEFGPIIIIIY